MAPRSKPIRSDCLPLCLNPPAARSILPITYKRTAMVLAGQSKAQVMEGITIFVKKESPALEPGAMTYMTSKEAYPTDDGDHNIPRAWVWVSGVEDGRFHPVDSAVGSQVYGVSKFSSHGCSILEKGRGGAIVMGMSPQLHIVTKGSASRIAIRAGKRILFIDSADIIAVEAEGHYILLQHKSSGYLLRESLSTTAKKLSLFGFVRIHRPSLVNAAFVDEIQPLSTGEYVLRVRGQEINSRSPYQKSTSSCRVVDRHRRFCPDRTRRSDP
jgi:hypothetical protein